MPCSPRLMLKRLRTWWRVARAQGKMLDGGWLFQALNPVEPLTARQLNRAVHEAASRRGSTSASRSIRYATVRDPPARAEGGHPRDPGAARPQEA